MEFLPLFVTKSGIGWKAPRCIIDLLFMQNNLMICTFLLSETNYSFYEVVGTLIRESHQRTIRSNGGEERSNSTLLWNYSFVRTWLFLRLLLLQRDSFLLRNISFRTSKQISSPYTCKLMFSCATTSVCAPMPSWRKSFKKLFSYILMVREFSWSCLRLYYDSTAKILQVLQMMILTKIPSNCCCGCFVRRWLCTNSYNE